MILTMHEPNPYAETVFVDKGRSDIFGRARLVRPGLFARGVDNMFFRIFFNSFFLIDRSSGYDDNDVDEILRGHGTSEASNTLFGMYDVESKPTLTSFLIQPATPSCLLSFTHTIAHTARAAYLHTLHTLRILRLLHASLRLYLCSVGPSPNWKLESRWRCSPSRCSSHCRLAATAAAAAGGSPMNIPARLPVR